MRRGFYNIINLYLIVFSFYKQISKCRNLKPKYKYAKQGNELLILKSQNQSLII